MKLHYETVSPLLKDILQKIMNEPLFNDFILVGGTCLSLQIGHRRSLDIDLFTEIEYGTMNTKDMKDWFQKSFPYCENMDSFDQPALGYSIRVGESMADAIKIDLFYTEKFIFPILKVDGIRLADTKEIAAMKIAAICQEIPRLKDFWDIHELSDKYTLENIIKWGIKRNEFAVSEREILEGFNKMDNVLGIPGKYRLFPWKLLGISKRRSKGTHRIDMFIGRWTWKSQTIEKINDKKRYVYIRCFDIQFSFYIK